MITNSKYFPKFGKVPQFWTEFFYNNSQKNTFFDKIFKVYPGTFNNENF